ncbi:probable mitochondrial-processing peptidase subunit beta, mitochondrial isoform X2 [Magnolia sinica]|uniref:probable mitochondrial-processing peptidase subunit beta, mitochondrial isoform X2 n=1 Tax=Magnolia sinica TaxID=86752 RepID=UPI00265B6DF6|nr:probable mitochondrial-processing peptidase subunit beta, mitochondrial isoform X2 [Magnolia sinica]
MALSSRITRKIKALSSYIGIRPLSISTHPQPSEEVTGERRFLLHSSPEPKLSDHSRTLRFPQTRISELYNDLRVVTQSSPTSAVQTASVGVWIEAGSRFETPQTNGTAHFLEHMIFKGTPRRSACALEEEIENMGARLNAYTSREQTAFYVNVLRDDVPIAVDILADVFQNSEFSENAIMHERGVILREMEEVQGKAEEVIFDHLHSAAFRNNPLGNTILGPRENIQKISEKDLFRYISTHYTGRRTVRVVNNDLPIAHLAIAFKGSGWADPNSIPVMVLQSLLGSWNKNVGVGNYSGSELAHRVSTDDLAESIMAFNTNYRDTGLFGIYSTAMPDCLPSLSLAIMQELRRMAHQISEAEVMRARNQLKSVLLLRIDGTSAVAENNGRQMLKHGRIVPFLELFARIDAVDAATIKETAKEFIINKDVAIAAMGPIHQLPDYNRFRSQTCMQ